MYRKKLCIIIRLLFSPSYSVSFENKYKNGSLFSPVDIAYKNYFHILAQ